MLNNITTEFSIHDLENLSGVKAHTIRIWEKRYKLLKPKRTDTNIRRYDIDNLRKLLNVTLLYNHGYKISTLAGFSESELAEDVNEFLLTSADKTAHVRSLKLAMLDFNQALFEETFQMLNADMSFSDLFTTVFLPFLNDIGLLWQTGSINPAHEHFISNLIRQKLYLNIEKLSHKKTSRGPTYVLFLPLAEMHELGLLFLHYKLLLQAKHSVYLGPGVPVEGLNAIRQCIDGAHVYITYLTVTPDKAEAAKFRRQLFPASAGPDDELWITGVRAKMLKSKKPVKGVRIFEDAATLIQSI